MDRFSELRSKIIFFICKLKWKYETKFIPKKYKIKLLNCSKKKYMLVI